MIVKTIGNIKAHIKRICSVRLYRKKCLFIAVHAIGLTMVTVCLQNKSIVQPEEMAFFKFFSLLKDDIFNKDEKPLADSVVFLDTSKDLALVDDPSFDAYGGQNNLEGAKILVTDRRKLAALFSELVKYQGQYRYAICDVSFEDASPDDSILRPQIERVRDAIFPKGPIAAGPDFGIQGGPVTYLVNEESFVKLPLFYNDSIKSLPVLMTETLSGKRFTRKYGFSFENGKPAFDAVLPVFYYRGTDLVRSDIATGHANTFYLGEIITIPGYFQKYLANKYIVIGNYSTDLHKTYFGEMPGSLILLDAFLTLREKSSAISFVWVMVLYLFYVGAGYKIFLYPEIKFEDLQKQIKVKFLEGFVKKYLSYTGLFIVLNIVSYFIFRNFVSLLVIGTYLTLLEETREKAARFRKSKNLLSFLKEEFI